MTTDPREAKLPVWARKHIETLRRQAHDAQIERDDARLATNPAESNTVLCAYSDIPIGLGKSPTVRFRLGESDRELYADARVEQDRDGRRTLHIMAGTTIHIEPRSSNVILMEVAR